MFGEREEWRAEVEDGRMRRVVIRDGGDFFNLPPPPSSSVQNTQTPPSQAPRPGEDGSHFREELWSGLREEDDERLDAIQGQFNSSAHVPRRWRRGRMEGTKEDWGVGLRSGF